ncbi:hypothetical protein [Hydrogenophaga sp. SL48]|uniref:hypothetical protein n=1 Tax=Hydrogenophaga sp. SL48 TaxID=2806347 RepID=UPI001F397B39|nr:hypothetical protein [Hydrogenophaga sp. SL48]UJW83463.1 hypothetical protein IM738_12725 [Hydrogenophaga sp. SL48]
MSPAFEPIHHLAQQGRAYAPALLAGADDPHAELLAMVWGPRFDRQHALDLWARLSQQQPAEALPLLPALLSAADRFDSLGVTVQHRLRRLIVRHRALSE